MNEFIDIYCERLGQGLWAEPLNALTNAAFFIAAFCAFVLARKEHALDWRSGLLIVLLLCIGTGSTLFHTFATFWAMLSDSLPILFYQITFLALYARYVMGWGCKKAAGLEIAFIATIAVFMEAPSEWLNGSLEYAPAFIFLFGLGIWHYKNARKERWLLLTASGLFLVSLTFRTIDAAICEVFPIGTHFFWHCLNGTLLYLTTRSYILNQTKT